MMLYLVHSHLVRFLLRNFLLWNLVLDLMIVMIRLLRILKIFIMWWKSLRSTHSMHETSPDWILRLLSSQSLLVGLERHTSQWLSESALSRIGYLLILKEPRRSCIYLLQIHLMLEVLLLPFVLHTFII
jgi:hypothetical protein